VLLDGGIIGYDSNTKTGGVGANYFAIGGDANYSEDTVTVYLRGTSVKTGEVLLSVVATKKILSYGVDANVFRYVTFNRLLQAEVGVTHNEPASLAVEQAIEEAVLQLIVEGSARGLWAFKDKAFQSNIIQDYELNYLAVAKAEATDTTGKGTPPANNGQNGGTAVAANGKPSAPAQSANKPAPAQRQAAATPANPAQAKTPTPAPVPVQPQVMQFAGLSSSPGAAPQTPAAYPQQKTANASGNAAPGQPQAQPQQQAQQPSSLPFVVQPRTLEDEVPIAPR
jgi:curli production assembly/transport component CsgG